MSLVMLNLMVTTTIIPCGVLLIPEAPCLWVVVGSTLTKALTTDAMGWCYKLIEKSQNG